MTVILVLGGARSGKSALAERLAGRDVVYVATGRATDADMAGRIAAHRARRPLSWTTVETVDLPGALAAHPDRTVLIDSLGSWLASHADLAVDPDPLLQALAGRVGTTVVVSEEVGMGVHPETEIGRRFRDALGDLNRRVAAHADRVVLVVAGRALDL